MKTIKLTDEQFENTFNNCCPDHLGLVPKCIEEKCPDFSECKKCWEKAIEQNNKELTNDDN